jgi:protein TonB
MVRHLVGAASSLTGTVGVFGLVLGMNAMDRGPKAAPEAAPVQFDVPPQQKKPPAKKRKPPPPKRQTPPKAPPPTPMLATAVGGLDLAGFGSAAIDLSEGAGALVGDASDVVMTAETVDALPVPVAQGAVPYPAAARSKGITGHVTVALQIDARGSVTRVDLVDADPPGVFDDAALRAVRGWRFQPATYQGAPVAVRVEQTLRFDLERQ